MTTKTVYQLDAHRWFAGETVAFESPLEPGVWHIPAGCVEDAPPVAPDGMRARHSGAGWMLEAWVPPPAPSALDLLTAFLAAHPEVAALVASPVV